MILASYTTYLLEELIHRYGWRVLDLLPDQIEGGDDESFVWSVGGTAPEQHLLGQHGGGEQQDLPQKCYALSRLSTP